MKLLLSILCALSVLLSSGLPAQAERIKDIASIAGVRGNQLVGYGIVVGLAGLGEGGQFRCDHDGGRVLGVQAGRVGDNAKA